MFDKMIVNMILTGIKDTLYMTLVSTAFGYLLGLPLGVVLAVTKSDGLKPNRAVYLQYSKKHSFPYTADPAYPVHASCSRAELRLYSDDRSAGDMRGSIHRKGSRIFT